MTMGFRTDLGTEEPLRIQSGDQIINHVPRRQVLRIDLIEAGAESASVCAWLRERGLGQGMVQLEEREADDIPGVGINLIRTKDLTPTEADGDHVRHGRRQIGGYAAVAGSSTCRGTARELAAIRV
jgi:hypothetical protein